MNRVVIPSQPAGRLPDAWRECVGTGRLNYAPLMVAALGR